MYGSKQTYVNLCILDVSAVLGKISFVFYAQKQWKKHM